MESDLRVRMSLEQNSKGTFQMDVTVESSSIEESKAKMVEAIDALKDVCKQKGLLLVGQGYGF